MPETIPIQVWVNRVEHRLDVPPRLLLVHLLRDTLGLTGTKLSCAEQVCGACTVLLDGRAVSSCATLAWEADGAEVLTIEGLAEGEDLHPVQQAFLDAHGYQCGFCTPGMILTAKALLEEDPDPDEGRIREYLTGNLCRCTGYASIVDAVGLAGRLMRGEA